MDDILAMKELNYAGIAYKVLAPFLREDINPADLKKSWLRLTMRK